MKSISKCSACGSENLEQNFYEPMRQVLDGGSHISSPKVLVGCHCGDCGCKFVFNRSGDCPICKGTGWYTRKSYSGTEKTHEERVKCPTCVGKGEL